MVFCHCQYVLNPSPCTVRVKNCEAISLLEFPYLTFYENDSEGKKKKNKLENTCYLDLSQTSVYGDYYAILVIPEKKSRFHTKSLILFQEGS